MNSFRGDVKRLLKSTSYVRIELRSDQGGDLHVSKKYKAHSATDRKSNAAYSYMALELFKERFCDVLISPEPIFDGAEEDEILMEYLPDLPTAERLDFRVLPIARPFFERCYSLESCLQPVETMYDSVLSTPGLKSMIDSGWPLRLGLKGDLYENLRHSNKGIILADVEGLAYEPYGLSELVLHANLCASLGGYERVLRYSKSMCPVAFRGLSSEQAAEICLAAEELFYNNMKAVPLWQKHVKKALVQKSFRKARMTYYS